MVTSALRFTNGGGVYRATCQNSGREVVIKEARPHTGFVGRQAAPERLAQEARWLRYAAEIRADLAPAIVEQFEVERHDFLAIEHLPGTPLHDWIARECPLYSAEHRSTEMIERYFQRTGRLLAKIRSDLDDLHAHGVAYGDLSPSNVIVDHEDSPRLIDFEACLPVSSREAGIGTPDFTLLLTKKPLTAEERDEYAFHGIALALVLRLTSLAEISAHVLDVLEAELAARVALVPSWWTEARDHIDRTASASSAVRRPSTAPYTLDPSGRDALRSAIADGLWSCCSSDRPWLFPSSKKAMRGATLSFSCGDSGILAALAAGQHLIEQRAVNRYARTFNVDSRIRRSP
jgi:serine/threonine protein kinase